MTKKIAFLDFDGTITNKDSLADFIRFYVGSRKFIIGFMWLLPTILGYKLKIVKNSIAKKRVLNFFFKGEPLETFQKKCDEYSLNHLPLIVREEARAELDRLLLEGYKVVIVSASLEKWLEKWCEKNRYYLIGTKVSFSDSYYIGDYIGENCYGEEKVKRIKEIFNLDEYQEILAYGDTSGDLPMLRLADKSFYKPFRK